MTHKTHDVIIVGGGPSGLSLAYQLRKLNIDCLILEKGNIAQSWRDMHDSLHLLSPMYANQLAGKSFSPLRWMKKIPKSDFIEYLEAYTQENQIAYRPQTHVEEVTKNGDLFELQTNQGAFTSRVAVAATGYFCNPKSPNNIESDDSIHVIHFANYKSSTQFKADSLKEEARILIVGGRVSAGQLLVELHEAGYDISLSVRSPIKTRLSGILGWLRENLYYMKEFIYVQFRPYTRGDSSALMDGGKTTRILKSKKAHIYPTIRRIQKEEVIFDDNTSAPFDIILMATGFAPNLGVFHQLIDTEQFSVDHTQLSQHKNIDGLFFLGLDNMINFRSRYLRGIVSDAKITAKEIKKYLNQK